jgi:uncharacterized membrane protein/ABC-type nitrate/sulfonate/bicarbonate transport system substrate-binding protein
MLNSWLHLLALIVYLGAVVGLWAILLPSAAAIETHEDRAGFLARGLKYYNPLQVGALGILIFTGAFQLTELKAMYRELFVKQVGYQLAVKLTFAFLLVIFSVYQSMGIGHRFVRRHEGGDAVSRRIGFSHSSPQKRALVHMHSRSDYSLAPDSACECKAEAWQLIPVGAMNGYGAEIPFRGNVMVNRKLRIIYRSNSHAPFGSSRTNRGFGRKNGLSVDTSPQLVREKSGGSAQNGQVDLISGNHHNLYVRNARNGEDFVHLAQPTNNWTENKLVVTDEIGSVQDLRGRKIVADRLTSHAGLNIWLFLRQEGLDVDRGDVELVELRGATEERWRRVLKGEFAATFVTLPHDARAAKAGARVSSVRAMPMIRGVTLTTTMSFIRSHEEEIGLLVRGFADAIHFFITQKEQTLEILKEHASPILHLESDDEVERLYEEWAHSLERKPYPALDAIANVFQLAVGAIRKSPASIPALWNSHYVRDLDDGSYIDRLYQ